MEAAVEVDTEVWRDFSAIEAKRILERLGMNPGGGIPALVECLRHRLYARLNLQDVIEQTDARVVFRMLDCRVQSARKRKGLAAHPCKSVGIAEYSEFAKAIDPRIRTRCIACPPDEHPGGVLVRLGVYHMTDRLSLRESSRAFPERKATNSVRETMPVAARPLQNKAQSPFCHRHQSL